VETAQKALSDAVRSAEQAAQHLKVCRMRATQHEAETEDQAIIRKAAAEAKATREAKAETIRKAEDQAQDIIREAEIERESIIRKAKSEMPLPAINVPIHNYEHLPKLEAPEGYVYVIQDVGHTRQCQFGYTNHPAASLYLFNGFLETRVVAILKTNNAPALEQELHEHYADQRTRGEWFELTDRQIQEIRRI